MTASFFIPTHQPEFYKFSNDPFQLEPLYLEISGDCKFETCSAVLPQIYLTGVQQTPEGCRYTMAKTQVCWSK